jgi:hypothetical protein
MTEASIVHTQEYQKLFMDIRERIRQGQYEALRKVNQELIALYKAREIVVIFAFFVAEKR